MRVPSRRSPLRPASLTTAVFETYRFQTAAQQTTLLKTPLPRLAELARRKTKDKSQSQTAFIDIFSLINIKHQGNRSPRVSITDPQTNRRWPSGRKLQSYHPGGVISLLVYYISRVYTFCSRLISIKCPRVLAPTHGRFRPRIEKTRKPVSRFFRSPNRLSRIAGF